MVDYILKNITRYDFNEIVRLSYNRIRPIFTTTFTTIAALIPLMINSEQSFWKSLALSVTGGIIISSIFTVMYVPVFFHTLNKR